VSGDVPTLALFNRVANTMAAMTLAYTPRTAAESDQVAWNRVLGYAEKGITRDFGVVGDATSWYSMMLGYNIPNWIVTDMRLMNRMDPQLPPKFHGHPDDLKLSTNPAADRRIATDWRHLGVAIGAAERGIFMLSPWYHNRYGYHAYLTNTTFTGVIPYILKAENDLLIAEALVRTNGDRAQAATLINNTRVGRGGLPPVSAGTATLELLRAIDYERDVELLNTNGFTLFHARHWEGGPLDRLQEGTWLHLPIPAKELETLQLPVYTFGGVGKPAM
ncbi:MAG: RagB/SusD family nutrient uptake outer membrane protein, partial [Gemmatimonadaceae bacterium]|nr:RagB/SusD family nutrient uptake outer membrane protein [Gemmatimonadaceae bacterium]